ncbi:hypothetical protein [Aliikangiella sp. IMCC44359]|uniref:hypothetical protein n=1 Tax=Aliikangiella sp. IMCC44359 TaxID=3459125 RepID=UPI00403AAF14
MTTKKQKLVNVKVENAPEGSQLVAFNGDEKQTKTKEEARDLAFGSWETNQHKRSYTH